MPYAYYIPVFTDRPAVLKNSLEMLVPAYRLSMYTRRVVNTEKKSPKPMTMPQPADSGRMGVPPKKDCAMERTLSPFGASMKPKYLHKDFVWLFKILRFVNTSHEHRIATNHTQWDFETEAS